VWQRCCQSGSTPCAWPTMLQSAKCGPNVVLVDTCNYSVCRDGPESDIRDGCHCVKVSGLFVNRGSQSTVTTIPRNIYLHKIFSQCRPVRDFAIMLSTASVGAAVKSTISLLSMIFEMAVL